MFIPETVSSTGRQACQIQPVFQFSPKFANFEGGCNFCGVEEIFTPLDLHKRGGGGTQRFCGSETLKVPFLVCQTIIAIYDDCCLQLYVYKTSYIYGEERDR